MTNRTIQQNSSLHLWLTMLAEALNDAGFSVNDNLVIKCDIGFTKENLKENVLDPFLENKNFRLALKDYGSKSFKTYDRKIQNDVTSLIQNLETKFRYTEKGAREVCIYVVDNDLAKKFSLGS